MRDRDEIYREFRSVSDTPEHIRAWTDKDNAETREKASLDADNEFHTASGRFHAERVLSLKTKSRQDWGDDDYEFAERVVNYAKRSAGIAAHHPHTDKAEVGDTDMTKNEIARRNWSLPAKPTR